jgi:hypothetical protein
MARTAYSEHDGRKRQEPAKYGEIRSLYPRSSHRAVRTPVRDSAAARKSAGNEVSVIGFKGVQAGIDEIAFRHDDDVEAWRDFVTTKNLSNQSLGSVSPDGAAEFARGGDSKTPNPALVGQQEHRRVAAVDLDAAVVDLLKLGAPSNPLGWSELQLFAADGKTLAALRAAPFEHQAAVFRAHPNEKTMRPLAVARIWLKCANSLGHDIPSL